MKWMLGVLAICATAACSSDGSKGASGSGGSGGVDPGGNGGPGNAACADPSTVLSPDADGPVGAMGIDSTNIYFLRTGKGIYSVPKAGGSVKPLYEADRFLLMLKNVMLVDADSIYFGRSEGIYKMPIAGGEPTVWVAATNMDQVLAEDADYIYFADDTEDTDSMPHGSIQKVKKSDGQATTLATGQAGPTGLILSGDTLYWQNMGSAKEELLERENDGGLMAVSKNGGSPTTLVAQAADGSGIKLAGSLSDLASDGTNVYFGSVNLDDIGFSGTYKVSASGGTPSRLDDLLTASAFMDGGSLFVDNGNRIASVSTSSGTVTNLACFPDALNGSIMMLRDETNIYFLKDDEDSRHSIRVLPYAH